MLFPIRTNKDPKDQEVRRRRREYDREKDDSPRSREKDKDKDRRERVSKNPDRKTLVEKEDALGGPDPENRNRSSSSSSQPRASKKVTMLVPEMRASESASSLPYPSFSKQHSREAVRSGDNVRLPSTPNTTDISKTAVADRPPRPATTQPRAPPSPPLTAEGSGIRRPLSTNNIKAKIREAERPNSLDAGLLKNHFSASRTSLRQAEEGMGNIKSPRQSPSTTKPSPRPPSARKPPTAGTPEKRSKDGNRQSLENGQKSRQASGIMSSDTTSIALERKKSSNTQLFREDMTPPPKAASSKTTPMSTPRKGPTAFTPQKVILQTLPRDEPIEVFVGSDSDGGVDTEKALAPPPPPPPPPTTGDLPRVDYLLQNGGLTELVPKHFAAAANPPPSHSYQQYMSPQSQSLKSTLAIDAFAPYKKLLDDYTRVIFKNGSVAVATGYRSVARRLLDRLESVFSRNISSETCSCVMCQSVNSSSNDEENNGVSWGEVLEFVSGRRDLPQWPPFSIATLGTGLGISNLEQEAPMQKLDVDVPPEYREHYIRQSKKTKTAVQNWLALQPEDNPTPPQEVDDETLTHAMLTYLETDQRRLFSALVRGLKVIPDSRAPTPLQSQTPSQEPSFMMKISLALQRLYRLPKQPRQPEGAMWLLNNPSLHNVLATLAAISDQEWEILISGRFDGFLWSGAEDQQQNHGMSMNQLPTSPPVLASRSLSRNATGAVRGSIPTAGPLPFRNSTPFKPNGSSSNLCTVPGPVQVDEETEIAVLAEIEREIYLGMEALEDAFESLHDKAETVRRALRERSAGLAVSAQKRRGSAADLVEVRMGTPASVNGFGVGMNGLGNGLRGLEDDDDGMGDDGSELAPDDSASNIGWKDHKKHKRRRPGRRTERRTPAPVEEEDEGLSDTGDGARRR